MLLDRVSGHFDDPLLDDANRSPKCLCIRGPPCLASAGPLDS
jgi:hypothetical protein